MGVTLDGPTRAALLRRHVRGRQTGGAPGRRLPGDIHEDREAHLDRPTRVALSRFRAGHHPDLGRWRALVGRTEDPTCRLCGEEEETAEHLWTRCPALELRRRQLGLGLEMRELTDNPGGAQALLGYILRRLR